MSEQFSVKYDGPALVEHEMNARDLAGSILALSDAVHRAQEIVSPGTELAEVRIKAFESGSFDILVILSDAWKNLVNVLDSPGGEAAERFGNLLVVLFGTIQFVRDYGHKKITHVEDVEPGKTQITFTDKSTTVIETNTYLVASDYQERKSLEKVVAPLDSDKVETVKVSKPGTSEAVEVTAAQAANFNAPAAQEKELQSSDRVVWVKPIGIELDWKKWRLSEGGREFKAAMKDESFRQRVDSHEIRLGANDLLLVDLHTEQYLDKSGELRSNYTITQVHKHQDGGQQIAFDLGI